MTTKPAIKVYLPKAHKEKFEKEAQKQGISLSTYMLLCAQRCTPTATT